MGYLIVGVVLLLIGVIFAVQIKDKAKSVEDQVENKVKGVAGNISSKL